MLGYENAFVILDTLNEVLGRRVMLKAFVDSRSVLDVIEKDRNTHDKGIKKDTHALRHCYANGELDRIGWITGDRNPADELTNIETYLNISLSQLMKMKKLKVNQIDWGIRYE